MIASGVDPNIRASALERTPLHVAAEYGRVDLVRFLLQSGADPTAKDTGGRSPSSLAASNGYAAVVDLLTDAIKGSGASTPADLTQADRVILKNGDVVTGALLTPQFSIKTSYTSLVFNAQEIAAIVLEGGGQNIETLLLKNGDKLSGVIEPKAVTVRLASGQQIDIQKDKIKEIRTKR